MSAPAEIRVPQLGESITEATIAAWLKKPGDPIAADEPVVELETDKVTVEVPAPASGVLAEILCEAGAAVEVGALLGRIGPGQSEAATPHTPPADAVSADSAMPEPVAPEPVSPDSAEPDSASLPSAAPSEAQSAAGPPPGGGPPPGPGPLSPAVRKLVAEHELEPGRITPSGPGGRLLKGDVLAAIGAIEKAPVEPETLAPEAPAARPAPPPAPRPGEKRVAMSRLRQTIARRLKQAQNTAAMLTTFNEADMSALIRLRREAKEAFQTRHGVRLGYMSFFVKACIAALREIPELNAQIDGEAILYRDYCNIGIAVGGERGLVVPVLHEAQTLSLAEIEKKIAEYAQAVKDGTLSLAALQGGTFTISNGGVYGSLLSTPILNAPQSGVLGMHKIEERPVAAAGEICIRPMMYLALTYDHRIVDGRGAVTFLVRVKEMIERPERLLVSL